MRKIKLLIIVILLFSTSGCWNYYELNEIAICTGMAIDKTDDGYEITYLISNAPKQETSYKEGQAGVTSYSGKGKTLVAANQDIALKMPMHPYHGHLLVVIVSEDVAKDGIEDVLDLMLRAAESRKNFYLILSKDSKAKDILQILSPLDSFPSNTIASDIESIKNDSAMVYEISYNDFISKFLSNGIEPVLNAVTVLGDVDKGSDEKSLGKTTPSANIKLKELGVFKNDKLLGWLSDDETQGINTINNKVSRIFIEVECDDNKKVTTSITNLSAKKTLEINSQDDINVYIDIKGSASIIETNCKIDLEDNEQIYEIEKKTNKKFKKIINKGIDRVQKDFKSDIIGIGNLIYKKKPKLWESINKDWNDNFFPNINFKVNINIEINNKGSLEQSLEVEKDEI